MKLNLTFLMDLWIQDPIENATECSARRDSGLPTLFAGGFVERSGLLNDHLCALTCRKSSIKPTL